ncbi:TPA: hypothetical protein NG675_000741 [Vibrio parahaemolyticus]|uniref:hypothetical protein n=1 Tax=Vibrio TaxID=662 RepID=UPI00193CE42E|nr:MULTISPECIES: hypothetical protein [Vibrio]EGQ9178439.1 hypothetical protein [Vibrio alginolyticus]MBM5028113.1 hypothetical protein [Vibrio parahaemolyticus]MDV5034841.1 hypothetical protein [Vibrio diabolicus]MDW1964884.1 hypothetical protein [Vibrio sp. Vb0587]HCG5303041.1 hypothetical protein [Vibrio parahaemolyticus]
MENYIKPRRKAKIKIFLTAIDSILSGNPKQKSKMVTLTLNNKNVEIESGQFLKHFPEVKSFIKAKKADPTVEWADNGVYVSSDNGRVITKSELENTDQLAKNERLESERDDARKAVCMYKQQADSLSVTLEKTLGKHHEMFFVLLDNIPDAKKEQIIKKFEDNVTPINFGLREV